MHARNAEPREWQRFKSFLGGAAWSIVGPVLGKTYLGRRRQTGKGREVEVLE